jgi:hypothetical protein
MSDNEHLAMLRKGATVWNRWRKRNPGVRPLIRGAILIETDLQGFVLIRADLMNANLSRANLRGVDLSGANLGDANLNRARLARAGLSRADLTGADLTGADLSAAGLRGANLLGANLSRAKLVGADLGGALLGDTILGDVDLESAIGLDACVHWRPSTIDFRTLSQSADLPISFLRGCGLPDPIIEYLPSLRGKAIRFYSCFISYSSKDQVFANRLHADAQNNGVRCWFAPHDLRIGEKTWDAIDEAIRLRDKLLVILSEASIGSDWVEDEVTKAYAEERERQDTVLFAVRIDDAVMNTTEPWARKLRDQRHIGDFRRWNEPDEYHKSLDRLLRDLKAVEIRG